MSNESNNFEILVSFPTLNTMLDDIENKILSPLSCLREFGSEWVLEFDLPLVKKNDIEVSVENEDTITIEAKLAETYSITTFDSTHEFHLFKKTITLPRKIDEKLISAKFDSGRLTIRIPKLETKKKTQIDL